MAGENAVLMSQKGVVTLDVTVDADVAKGDVIAVGLEIDDMPVFALSDGKAGEVVTCVKEAALVRIDTPKTQAFNKVLKAGQHLRRNRANGNILVARVQDLKGNTAIVGVLHHQKPANAAHMYIVWRAL